MKASELKQTVKTALEASPLFAAEHIPVFINLPSDTASETAQETELRREGGGIVLAVTPVYTREKEANRAGELIKQLAHVTVFLRINKEAADTRATQLDVDDLVDEIVASVSGQAKDVALNPRGIEPAEDLSAVVPDQGLYTNAVRFHAFILLKTRNLT